MLKSKLVSFLWLIPALLWGANVETDSIISVLSYINDGTLVVVDIDNTLIESSQQVGSIQWGDYLAEEYLKRGEKSYEEVDCFVSDYWCRVQPYIKVRCVDPNTPRLIKKLQEKGVTVLGLTARRPNEIQYTLQQLSSVNIDLTDQQLRSEALDIPVENQEGALYEKGILFCTPVHKKSSILEVFLSQLAFIPKKIIFIDDKISHVLDLEKFSKKIGADYVGIRFSGADKRVKTFNPEIANLQYQFLPTLITDEEAEELLVNKDFLLSFKINFSNFDETNDNLN